MADFLSPDLARHISDNLAKQYQIERDSAGPKAVHSDIEYKGVLLSSRYDLKRDFAQMRSVIDEMTELMARRLESIWCDSLACDNYMVVVKEKYFCNDLPEIIESAFRVAGGHNGITVHCDGVGSVEIDPFWYWGYEDENLAGVLSSPGPTHT